MNNFIAIAGYQKLMKGTVGLTGEPSPRDKIFACPADTFYFDAPPVGHVPHGFHEQAFTDYSSYAFNAGGRSHGLMAPDFDLPAEYGYKWKAD